MYGSDISAILRRNLVHSSWADGEQKRRYGRGPTASLGHLGSRRVINEEAGGAGGALPFTGVRDYPDAPHFCGCSFGASSASSTRQTGGGFSTFQWRLQMLGRILFEHPTRGCVRDSAHFIYFKQPPPPVAALMLNPAAYSLCTIPLQICCLGQAIAGRLIQVDQFRTPGVRSELVCILVGLR
jgi:hypothetical protein